MSHKSQSRLPLKKVQTSISASAHVSIIYNTYHHCLINAVRPKTTQQALKRPIRSLWLLKQEAVAETGARLLNPMLLWLVECNKSIGSSI